MISNKEKIYYYMQETSHQFQDEFLEFTTQELAESLNLQRTNVSTLLNELVKEGKVIKKSGRPVRYSLKMANLDDDMSCFNKLCGNNITLKNAIQLAKAAILYPNEPLVTLIVGDNGTGKSYFASLMAEFAKVQNIINDSELIKINCSHYEDNEDKLIMDLFGENETDNNSLISRSQGGALFIDHIEYLNAHAKNSLIDFIENKNRLLSDTVVVFSISNDSKYMNDSYFISKFSVIIRIPSLQQYKLEERLELVQKFFNEEASKMNKKIKINSELLRCFLLYYCEGNLKQLKYDIRISCANAYVRSISENDDTIYVYLHDCPNYIRKGFLFYKDNYKEIEALIPEDYSYTFTSHQIQTTRDTEINRINVYDNIERKISDLRNRGIGEEDISTIISVDMDNEIGRYTKNIEDNNIDRESLSKIVDKGIIEIVDRMLKELSSNYNRIYPSSTFSGLCLHSSNVVQNRETANRLTNDKIMEIVENHKTEYSICVKYASMVENEYDITISIDDVIVMVMLLCNHTDESERSKEPVLLIVMHGTIASAMSNVVNTLISCRTYAYDLLLDKDMYKVYDELKHFCLQIDNGAGILVLYDMGSIKKMLETVVFETGLNIKSIEIPSTLIALDSVLKLKESNDLEEAYNQITSYQNGTLSYFQDNYRFIQKTGSVIISLCMIGKGAAVQIKQYLESNLDLSESTSVVALAISNRQLLINEMQKIMEYSTILCIVGTYDPKLYGIPFISISTLFNTPVEKLPMLLALEDVQTDHDFDYTQIYEYLEENLNNADIPMFKEYLLPAVKKILKRVDNYSIDLEIGLFVHIACSIDRMLNNEPMPANIKKNQVLSRNKILYNDIKQILNPLENVMNISFSDDEVAIIIDIVK